MKKFILTVMFTLLFHGAEGQEINKPTRYTIIFSKNVNASSVDSLINAVLEASLSNASEIRLVVASSGGDIDAAILAYNVLRGVNIPVHTYGVGQVSSSANIIFLAGDTRTATPNSVYLIHKVKFNRSKNDDLLEYAEIFDFNEEYIESYARVFSSRTFMKQEHLLEILSGGDHSVLEAKEAVSAGIANWVGDLDISADPNRQEIYYRIISK